MDSAISKMFQPTNAKDLQCFLGMVSYLNKYSPRLTELGGNLYELTKKYILFLQGAEDTEPFNVTKQDITSVPVLNYYNQAMPLCHQTDINFEGFEAALLQDEHLIYFASINLQPHHKSCVAIEREELAVAWDVEMFHYFPVWHEVSA